MKTPLCHLHNLLLTTLIALCMGNIDTLRAQTRIDSLLRELDHTIDNQALYIKSKYARIDSFTKAMMQQQLARQTEAEYPLCRALTEEYIPFKFDSAYLYATHSLKLARQIGNRTAVQECQLTLANILMTGGLFEEAMGVLNGLKSSEMAPEQQALLYSTYDLTFLHHAKYIGTGPYTSPETQTMRNAYLDSLSRVVEYKPENYRMLSRLYIEREEPALAKLRLQELLHELPMGTRAYAIVASSLAFCYELVPEGELRKEYLIRSAISDLRGAVRENESLRQLALLLFKEGDIDRAHRYISISIADANFYNARLRCIEAANTYPIIQEAYREIRDAHLKRLQNLTIVAVLLFVIVGCIGLVLHNRIKALRKTRSALSKSNEELRHLNERLTDSNCLKQEQVASVLVLCSSYINKLERQQAMTHNLLSLGKVAQLKEAVSSSQMLNEEIREFYHTFDRMVLKLYPDFVEKINQLLREEERISPSNEEGLTTELRIYALICLGIADSAQIARFLRYSSNTVYTYRTKMRNKAIDKLRFEEQIRSMGLY